MFDWFKKLFGEGKIRVEFTDESGKEFVGKVPYIGDINTLDKKELLVELSNQWLVRTGARIVELRVIGGIDEHTRE